MAAKYFYFFGNKLSLFPNRRAVLKIVDMLHSSVCYGNVASEENKINSIRLCDARNLSGSPKFKVYLRQATTKKLLDSELTLICESARGLHEKKVLARTLLLSVHRAFAHARAFLLDKKKMTSLNNRI